MSMQHVREETNKNLQLMYQVQHNVGVLKQLFTNEHKSPVINSEQHVSKYKK